jgi:hypothetical protein
LAAAAPSWHPHTIPQRLDQLEKRAVNYRAMVVLASLLIWLDG